MDVFEGQLHSLLQLAGVDLILKLVIKFTGDYYVRRNDHLLLFTMTNLTLGESSRWECP